MEKQLLRKSGTLAIAITFILLGFWFGFAKFSLGAYNEKNLTKQFLAEDSEIFKTVVIEVGSDTVARIIVGTSSMVRTGTSSYQYQPRIQYDGATGLWSFKNSGGTETTAFGTATSAYIAAEIGSNSANYVLKNGGSSTGQLLTDSTIAGSTTIGSGSTITAGGAPFDGIKVGYLADVTDFIQAQINAKQDTIGQTPLGSSVGSVTAALGSQSVGALLDVDIISPADGHKLSYDLASGKWIAATSSASVDFGGVLGSSTDNVNFSRDPGFSKVPVTGSTSTSLAAWISGTISVQSITATATATFGTSSQINNSVVTIYGTNSPTLNISYGEGVQEIISADMTSDSAPSPNVTSASTTFSGDYLAWQAFDRNPTTKWLSQNGVTTGWVKYDFGAGNAKILSKYTISLTGGDLPGNAPKNFTLQGSNNDADWTILDTQSNMIGYVADTAKTFYITPYSTAYRYYKLDITTINGGSYIAVGELALYKTGFSTVMSISEQGIVSLGTTTPKSTDTAFIFQVEGNGLANSWGVACFGAIKEVIGSGSDVIKQGFDAVMGTKIFTHHPKKQISREDAESMAINDYVNSFTQIDFETFKTDNISKYTTTDGVGSTTVSDEALTKEFRLNYVLPRVDEFYVTENAEQKILSKRKEMEADKTIVNITPISDHVSTSPLLRLNNSVFLSIENQIGALMATAQYQQEKIVRATTDLENLRIAHEDLAERIKALEAK